MAKDHYIAQTYMKHFADAGNNNNLHVYSKNPRKYYTASTRNVCCEEDWDTNPYFENERAIESYLSATEPYWDSCVDNISNLQNDKIIKVILSGYIAVLSVCTPASVRTGADRQAKIVEHTATMLMSQKQENPNTLPDFPSIPKELVGLVDKPNFLKIEIDPKYPHAMGISILPRLHWNFYSADWLVLINDTENFFLTSDFPVTYYYPNQRARIPFRFVPISPRIGILMRPSLEEADREPPQPEPASWPETKVDFGEIKPRFPKILNTLSVQSAERFVISPQDRSWISDVVEKYKDWRMENDTAKIPASQSGTYLISRIRPRAIIKE